MSFMVHDVWAMWITYVEKAFGNRFLLHPSRFRLVISIRVECLVGHDMILEEGLEILLTILTEQERINLWAELLESEIARGEKCSTEMGRSIVDRLQKASLDQSKLESAELSRE